MKHPCGALFVGVAASWSAATSADCAELQSYSANSFSDAAPLSAAPWLAVSNSAGLLVQDGLQDGPAPFARFRVSTEFDGDLLASLGELSDEASQASVFADLRWRFDAEAISRTGIRYGVVGTLAIQADDGRRGLLGASTGLNPDSAGLVTGLGQGRGDNTVRAGAQRLEAYIRAQTVEVFAGLGESAARRHRPRPPRALRLARADGGVLDPVGGALASTDLSIGAPSASVTVQTRRLVGFVMAASLAPEVDVCGPVSCRISALSEIDNLASLSIDFDRRAPSSGVRWQAQLGLEFAQSRTLIPGVFTEDPILASLQIARTKGPVSVNLSALTTNDGRDGAQYDSISAGWALEQGDWLFDAELAGARSDLIDQSIWTAQLGVSRFVGRKGLAGLAIRLQGGESGADGAALLAEAGLRF